jgi:hypothetical protein
MNRESNQFACAHPNRVKSKLTGMKLKSMSNSKYSMILVVIKQYLLKKIFTFLFRIFSRKGWRFATRPYVKLYLYTFYLASGVR